MPRHLQLNPSVYDISRHPGLAIAASVVESWIRRLCLLQLRAMCIDTRHVGRGPTMRPRSLKGSLHRAQVHEGGPKNLSTSKVPSQLSSSQGPEEPAWRTPVGWGGLHFTWFV
eukprot:s7317_g3.t1